MNDDLTLVQQDEEVDSSLQLSRQPIESPLAIPGYAILNCLGEGAYGAVWLAREENTGKQVAIKFYTHRRGLDWSLLSREVEKLAVLYTSRNIVRLLGVGWDSDPPYYIMEYIENGSLAAFLSEGALPAHEAVRIAKSVLRALVHAHGSGILHCDLKPANVLLDADFEPRLCDFGQSRLSDEQDPALGTLFYMAPEQADMKAIPDARWDVYALGALLYQMLCGHAPFRTPENESRIAEAGNLGNRLAMYQKILRESPRPNLHRKMKGVDKRLIEIVDRCLKIDPRRRFPNAQAVLEALEVRDQQRARRPRIVLGIIGPLVLLGGLSPFAYSLFNRVGAEARDHLSVRALDGDEQTASFLARGLQRDLEDRGTEFLRIASGIAEYVEEDIAEYVEEDEEKDNTEDKGGDKEGDKESKSTDDKTNDKSDEKSDVKRGKWLVFHAIDKSNKTPMDKKYWLSHQREFEVLRKIKEVVDESRVRLNRPLDISWFIDDIHGVAIWREPYSDLTIGENYSRRDYFHGRGMEYKKGEEPEGIIPIQEEHVSLAFRSEADGRLMVAVTVPIRNNKGEVIGVLARTTHLGKLLAEYGANISTDARKVALVECRNGQLLAHPWLTKDRLGELSNEEFRMLTLDSKIVEDLNRMQDARRQADKTTDNKASSENSSVLSKDPYTDPIGLTKFESADEYEGEWLAAFALVGDTGWAVIVQERKEDALSPVKKMQDIMIRNGLGAAGVACALIGLMWYFVNWVLSDRKMQVWLSRSGTVRAPGDTSTASSRSDRSDR